MANKILDVIDILLKIFLIIFGLIILYQIIPKISGGSWMTENLVVALLIALIGIVFTNSVNIAKMRSDYSHLLSQFKCLAGDFKLHCKPK